MAGVVELSGTALAGALLFCAGAAWFGWALALHHAVGHRVGQALALHDAPAVLIDEGPYRVGRHPMYLGLLVMLLGLALGLALPGLALVAVAAALWFDRIAIVREEAQLAARFGGWWHDYAAAVRRWV